MYDELIYWMESLARGTAGRKVARAAADAINALQSENAEKDKEIERLRKELAKAHTMETLTDYNQDYLRSEIKRVETERDAAKKCIYDIETYLAFGSAQYIGRTIQAWKRGAQGVE